MKKLKSLQKQLITTSAIAVAICIIVGILSWVTSGFVASTQADKRKRTSEISGLNSQRRKIEAMVGLSTESSELYDKISSNRKNQKYILDRKEAAKTFSDIRRKYRLSAVNLSISSPEKITSSKFKLLKNTITRSEMEIKMSAMSDTHIFSMLKDLNESMAGFFRIKEFSLTKDATIKRATLVNINSGANPKIVTATAIIEWVGLQKPATEEKNGALIEGKKAK